MNPFDLSGPAFLAFYAAFGVMVLVALFYLQRQEEKQVATGQLDPSDPYAIAYLRGGPTEALRVATVALIDRGLLKVKESKKGRRKVQEIHVGRPDAADFGRRPIERALLTHFGDEHRPQSILSSHGALAATEQYEGMLSDLGLIPTPRQLAARRGRALFAALVLAGVSALKIWVALDRGRTNIWFLVGLTGVFVYIAFRFSRRGRTSAGDANLADLRTLFATLRERADIIRPGGATNEMALLTAVYGLHVLATPDYTYVHTLYPKAATTSAGDGGGWGTSCGSIGGDGGDGGGSSCGGGSCGGGCGGCGGG